MEAIGLEGRFPSFLNAIAVMKKKMVGIGLEVRFPGFLNAIAVIPGEDSNLH